ICEETTPALHDKVANGRVIISDLLLDPRNRERSLAALPLFLKRGKGNVMLPEDDRVLQVGDRILMCGSENSEGLMQWTTKNANVLGYVLTGQTESSSYVLQWLYRYYTKSKTRLQKNKKLRTDKDDDVNKVDAETEGQIESADDLETNLSERSEERVEREPTDKPTDKPTE
ncbi:MAG: hypothetical protein V3U84_08835, partial [Thiotrichaceae bacterium]